METYLNPVAAVSCADPFVLKYLGEYWCYASGRSADGGYFPILSSSDLVHWSTQGSAMQRLPAGTLPVPDTCYWAPEVFYANGIFYLYYSAGNETFMQVRVATSDSPAGPFVDSGKRLTREDFAIDAHVFEDDEGQRYLFYATDFLDHTRVGTGTVMDRLLDPFSLAGERRPVTRAKFDWQIYDPCRLERGGACWHTLEGSFVLKHSGRYYQMFSGGNWQNSSYGVAYGTTDRLDRDGEWEQPCDGTLNLPVLRSLPEAGVIGPGHNSVVRGPDNRELFCVYHRWQPETHTRVMAIDRLGWEGERLFVHGPSFTPQPAPRRPDLEGFDTLEVSSGEWRIEAGRAAVVSGPAEAELRLPASEFLLEISLRGKMDYGIGFEGAAGGSLQIHLRPEQPVLAVRVGQVEELISLPAGFSGDVYHLLRLETGPAGVSLGLDGPGTLWRSPGRLGGAALHLHASDQAAFAGLAVTSLPPA